MLKVTIERGKTHGKFSDNARISQRIKEAMRDSPNWEHMTDEEKEAFEMIALKISRACSGKMCKQHVEDIVGYASLIEEMLL